MHSHITKESSCDGCGSNHMTYGINKSTITFLLPQVILFFRVFPFLILK